MQTILGSDGQIARELALELRNTYTDQIRLSSRNPKSITPSDELVPANLMNLEQTMAAVQDSEIVYFTAGLPADTELWERQFPHHA